MKRLLLPGSLFFFLCFCLLAASANAQDSTKKAEPEIKIATPPGTSEKKDAVKSAVQPASAADAKTVAPKIKRYSRYHKIYPAVNPTAPVVNAAPPVKNPAITAKTPVVQINKDSLAKVNAAKTQIDPAQLNAKSLNNQYQYLLTKTLPEQQPLIAALWKNVTDSLNHERSQLKDAQSKLALQNHAADSLKTELNTQKEQVSSGPSGKSDSISMFGLAVAKSTYNLIMFGLVIGLAVALVIVVLTIAKYKHDAKHHIELAEELEDEYKTFKAKANEKELRLARELQTERNKLDELMGRG